MSKTTDPDRSTVAPGALTALLRQLAGGPQSPSADEQPSFRPGQSVGRFELVREVARGGFGVVFEARDRELGRAVAFKALRKTGTPDAIDERLLREAEAAARLTHPNIVTLHDVGRCEQGAYLVLELLHGVTLAQRLERGPIAPRDAVGIAVEVAKGLAHAHAQGVVHRDLTPGNVFLCDDGQVKVLDFGMAHAFGRRKLDGGTPAFMAPEQWTGAPEDERTDVFALGVILYELLAGELPFADEKELQSSRPAPALRVEGDPRLGALIARMLAKDPVSRPRDAAEALAALTEVRQALEPAAPTAVTVRRSRRSWRAALAVLVLLLVVAIAASYLVLGDAMRAPGAGRAPERAETVRSIAVLPFADLSPQRDQQYLSDGVAEEILNALARVEGLRVVGRSSSFSFREKNEDLRVIGQKLDARTLLEGTIRRAGDRLRVSAQLIDVASGYQLWAETYDREITDIFEVQEEIAGAVVRALEVKLQPPGPAADEHRTKSPEAYQQYLIGKHLFYRGTYESSRLGAKAFEKAIAIDPRFAPAWAQLSAALLDLYLGPGDAAERADLRRRAIAAADRAVELAPDLAEAYSARALARASFLRQWREARADHDRAVALQPRSAQEHRRRAIFLGRYGELDEAIRSALTAVELDPLSGVAWRWLAIFQSANGRNDLARTSVARALEILPESEYAHRELATYAVIDGRPSEALSEIRFLVEEDRLLITAVAEHDLGHAAVAQRALDELVARIGSTDGETIAGVYARWGDRDRAFAWLARAIEEDQVMYPRLNPFLRGLHGDPRWDAMLRELGLPAD